jgi:aspartate-semialdehyde dehydrogenase
MNRNPHVAVVGATGAVGIEMIKTLEKRSGWEIDVARLCTLGRKETEVPR